PPGASETDESEERAQGNSPGIRGRLPRQTRPRAHKHHRKRGVRQTTPRSSPIFTRRGWARRRGELAGPRAPAATRLARRSVRWLTQRGAAGTPPAQAGGVLSAGQGTPPTPQFFGECPSTITHVCSRRPSVVEAQSASVRFA